MLTLFDAIAQIDKAWRQGRAIVPVIGAGLSADAGVPVLAGILRYLISLEFLLHGAPLATQVFSITRHIPFDGLSNLKISDLIKRAGWPDRYVLNAELHALLAKTGDVHGLEFHLNKMRDCVAKTINSQGWGELKAFAARIDKNITDSDYERALLKHSDSVSLRILSDWKQIIRWATNHDTSLADSLFMHLYSNRNPGPSHVFLVHLCRVLGVKSVLTLNFDNLLESAFQREGMAINVFEMAHGTTLPSQFLLQGELSLIKMHGGKLDLLLDERLDYPLNRSYKRRFTDIVGNNPLLLVIGCSGGDQRLRDLIDAATSDETGTTNTLWFDYGKDLRDSTSLGISERAADHTKLVRFRDTTQTLACIYTELTGRLPSSRTAYTSHIQCPLFKAPGVLPSERQLDIRPACVHLLQCLPGEDIKPNLIPARSASRCLTSMLYHVDSAYKIIWIDLEEHYSLGGLVAEIVEQCRNGDTELTPSIFAVDDSADQSSQRRFFSSGDLTTVLGPELAAQRVCEALNRDRYVLAIDGIDAFPWRPTVHHGMTTRDGQLAGIVIPDLVKFLRALATEMMPKWKPGDSMILASIDHPRPRHHFHSGQMNALKMANFEQAITGLGLVNPHLHRWNIEYKPESLYTYVDRKENEPLLGVVRNLSEAMLKVDDFIRRLALHLIVSARRVRTRILMTYLLRGAFASVHAQDKLEGGSAQAIQLFLVCLLDAGILHEIEGNGYWMDRPMRDTIYDYNTDHASKHSIKKDTTPNLNARELGHALTQLIVASCSHDYLAKTYYTHLFLPSHDCNYFVEYTYHRVSSCRYLLLLERLAMQGIEIGARFTGMNLPAFETMGIVFASLFEGNALESFESLLKRAHHVRTNALQGLLQSWSRDEAFIRSRLPAETVIVLCDSLLDPDLPDNVCHDGKLRETLGFPTTRFDVGLGNPTKKNASKDVKQFVRNEEHAIKIRDSLMRRIANTLAKAHYERGDFYSQIRCRLGALARIGIPVPNLSPGMIINLDIVALLSDACHNTSLLKEEDRKVEAFHYILDVVIAVHWLLCTKGLYTRQTMERLRQFMDVEFTGARGRFQKSAELDPEIKARAWYILLEMQLNDFRVLDFERWLARKGGPDADVLHNVVTGDIATVVETKEKALKLRRDGEAIIDYVREDCPRNYPLHSPLLNPTADQSLFVPYHSLFHILLGRIDIYLAIMSSSTEECTRAFRECELARAGVGEENTILIAMADLFSAQAALAHASYVSHEGGKGDLPTRIAKLRSASAYLRRCISLLTRSPRYTLLWREYYVTLLRYQAERLLLLHEDVGTLLLANERLAFREKESDRLRNRFVELVLRVRRSLTTIRHLLDYSPENATQSRIECSFLWFRLTFVGLNTLALFGIWKLNSNEDGASLGDMLNGVWVGWREASQIKGIDLVPGAEAFFASHLGALVGLCKSLDDYNQLLQPFERQRTLEYILPVASRLRHRLVEVMESSRREIGQLITARGA